MAILGICDHNTGNYRGRRVAMYSLKILPPQIYRFGQNLHSRRASATGHALREMLASTTESSGEVHWLCKAWL